MWEVPTSLFCTRLRKALSYSDDIFLSKLVIISLTKTCLGLLLHLYSCKGLCNQNSKNYQNSKVKYRTLFFLFFPRISWQQSWNTLENKIIFYFNWSSSFLPNQLTFLMPFVQQQNFSQPQVAIDVLITLFAWNSDKIF